MRYPPIGVVAVAHLVGPRSAPSWSICVGGEGEGPFITALPARLTGTTRLDAGKITDEEFYFVRHVHLVAYADYAMKRHLMPRPRRKPSTCTRVSPPSVP
jgi:hypothetical protein